MRPCLPRFAPPFTGQVPIRLNRLLASSTVPQHCDLEDVIDADCHRAVSQRPRGRAGPAGRRCRRRSGRAMAPGVRCLPRSRPARTDRARLPGVGRPAGRPLPLQPRHQRRGPGPDRQGRPGRRGRPLRPDPGARVCAIRGRLRGRRTQTISARRQLAAARSPALKERSLNLCRRSMGCPSDSAARPRWPSWPPTSR